MKFQTFQVFFIFIVTNSNPIQSEGGPNWVFQHSCTKKESLEKFNCKFDTALSFIHIPHLVGHMRLLLHISYFYPCSSPHHHILKRCFTYILTSIGYRWGPSSPWSQGGGDRWIVTLRGLHMNLLSEETLRPFRGLCYSFFLFFLFFILIEFFHYDFYYIKSLILTQGQ